MLSLVPLDGHGAGQGPHRSDREVQEEATGYSSDGRTEGGRILFGWQSRLGHSGSRHRTTRSSYSRRHPNLHEAGPNGKQRRRPCPLDCGKERSSLLSPSLTSGHGTRNIYRLGLCSCGRRALLPARGYWSLGNFLRRSLVRGVGVSPSASCGCRTRISARGREAPWRPRCKRFTTRYGRPNLSRRGTKVCIALFGFAPFLGTRVWAAAGRTGQGLAAAADAADHSRKAPTSPRHDDARRGLAGHDHDTSGRRHAAAMRGGLAGCFDGFLRITFGCDDYRGGGGRFSCSKEAESRSSTKRQGAAAFSLSGHDGLGYTRICRSLLLRVERRLRAR